jgi:DNA polymerase I-like protein with 3'-5' exonuclease and polymerase domains
MAKRGSKHVAQPNQGLMFEPESDWRPPDVSSLPSWEGVKRIGIDTETCDPQLKEMGIGVRRGGRAVGISVAFEDGPAFYLPYGHEGGDNLEKWAVIGYVKEQAAKFKGEICGMNLAYDLDYLWEEGIIFPQIKMYRDAGIAGPLIDELKDSYSLNNMLKRADLPEKDERALKAYAAARGMDPKADLWRFPARHVGPYGEWDGAAPMKLLRKQEREIEEQDLWNVYDLECKVMPVLVKMRRRGVRIDFRQLERVERAAIKAEQTALELVYRETGVRVRASTVGPDGSVDDGDVWKAAAIGPALKAAGVAVGVTEKGAISIRGPALDQSDHPVAKYIVRARKWNKVRTTFAQSIRKHAVKDRIHCSFNQLRSTDEFGNYEKGAAFGRLSSENPNMQQQPTPDREPIIGLMWRKCFVPDEGKDWTIADYTQQEPFMTFHFAELMGLPGARENNEMFRADPTLDAYIPLATAAGITRKIAKVIFLALCYGMGGKKLCVSLGLPTEWVVWDKNARPWKKVPADSDYGRELVSMGADAYEDAGPEGRELLAKFDDQVPFVRKLQKECMKAAERRGYIKTISGRRCRFPLLPSGKRDWMHKALNRLIQGSSADQTKEAIVALDDAGVALQLQVHDEVDFSTNNLREALAVKEIMCNVRKLQIPTRVDIEVGPNWGQAKKPSAEETRAAMELAA